MSPSTYARKSLKLVVIVILGVICLQGIQMESNLASTRRDLLNEEDRGQEQEQERLRPVIHTFYEPIFTQGFDGDHSPIIKAWREEWTRAGFETRILTLADAKRHPYFGSMEKVVKELFGACNQYCFYRYLAMAANGGGWMSDNDTFPANIPALIDPPNGGKFTSFQGHVPALISASADEWLRIAKLMVDNIPTSTQSIKSDMMMLLDLRQQGNHDIDFTPVWSVAVPKLFWIEGEGGQGFIDCNQIEDKTIAFHMMSHASLATVHERGLYPIDTLEAAYLSGQERADVAQAIIAQWRKQGKCNGVSTSI